MHTQKGGKIAYILFVISAVPLLLCAIVIVFLSTEFFTRAMYKEIESELGGAAKNVIHMIDLAYPGDYELVGETALSLFKGDHDLTGEFSLVDRVKEDSGFDVTLFYQDTRILTTIRKEDGQRLIGSSAPQLVLKDVLSGGEPHFYTNTIINGQAYFSYYIPLRNSDDSIVGMVFLGKPSSQIDLSIRRASYPLVIAMIAVTLLIALFLYLYTRKFDVILQNICSFLTAVSTGNLTAELDGVVLKRNDEFGDIGRAVLNMQQSLRQTVDHDSLTDLYNRRCANRKLRQIMERSEAGNTPFCVCLGDIDFFKTVNDTYGHECGDEVLKQVAGLLRDHMRLNGFAARWGGEEFLLVFDRMDMDQAYSSLSMLMEKIRQAEIRYEDQILHVTMTFGLTAGEHTDHTTLLKNADRKLYDGKAGGRDRIEF